MGAKTHFLLGIILCLTVVSESRVIVPRDLSKYESSEDGEAPLSFEKDRKSGFVPDILDPPADDEFSFNEDEMGANDPRVPPLDNDSYEAVKDDDDNIDNNKPEIIVERLPSDEECGEDAIGKSDENELADGEESEEDDSDEDGPMEEEKPDEKRREEDEKNVPEDDKNEFVPNEAKNDLSKNGNEEPDELEENNGDSGFDGKDELGYFGGDPLFDNPIFNLGLIKKYFKQIERALGHVAWETLDEALLMNGTYANITEEEVEINGQKYIVQKSVIKGADNHSSIYIETLSSKAKIQEPKKIKVD